MEINQTYWKLLKIARVCGGGVQIWLSFFVSTVRHARKHFQKASNWRHGQPASTDTWGVAQNKHRFLRFIYCSAEQFFWLSPLNFYCRKIVNLSCIKIYCKMPRCFWKNKNKQEIRYLPTSLPLFWVRYVILLFYPNSGYNLIRP